MKQKEAKGFCSLLILNLQLFFPLLVIGKQCASCLWEFILYPTYVIPYYFNSRQAPAILLQRDLNIGIS